MNDTREKNHIADICVVGGGLAGMCAALSAARHGCKVVLIHDRPVFGGNCSSEIRMWPMGSHGSNRRETGIFEEILLENMRVNPRRTYPIWDAVLYNIMHSCENLTNIMNCSVHSVETDGSSIRFVIGWQLTTYTTHRVNADLFIDCSGDSILGLLSGAEKMRGREARSLYGEPAAPEIADSCTMGNSLLLQARETKSPAPYVPPCRIRNLTEDDFESRRHIPSDLRNNYWWIELGGDRDTLYDCEEITKELLPLTYGVWDHIKNGGEHNAENWELDWVGFLPGKRESFRLVGDYVLNQNDVSGGVHFDDVIAYGGWKVDDHPPEGFDHRGEPTRYFPSTSPFEIPYRCIYSANVRNLLFAGRNISVSHCALAASRVMATCAMLGQAAGTAAYIAKKYSTTPRGVQQHIEELQQVLMQDDCWIPGHKRKIAAVCKNAVITAQSADADNLRNGTDRPTDEGGDNGCYVPLGSSVVYTLQKPTYIKSIRLVFDSDLNRKTVTGGIPAVADCPTICNRPFDMPPFEFPATMTDSFDILIDGEIFKHIEGNYQRKVVVAVEKEAKVLAVKPLSTFGAPKAHIFAFDFE